MHPLPCPGHGCRTTVNQLFVDIMVEYPAEVAAGTRPPGIWEPGAALGSCHGWLRRQQGGQALRHQHSGARRGPHRRSAPGRGPGDDQIIWNAKASRARFNAAMAFLPRAS